MPAQRLKKVGRQRKSRRVHGKFQNRFPSAHVRICLSKQSHRACAAVFPSRISQLSILCLDDTSVLLSFLELHTSAELVWFFVLSFFEYHLSLLAMRKLKRWGLEFRAAGWSIGQLDAVVCRHAHPKSAQLQPNTHACHAACHFQDHRARTFLLWPKWLVSKSNIVRADLRSHGQPAVATKGMLRT